MVVVVAVVVVGVPIVVIIVVVGPGGASNLYALPLLLSRMPCNCILFVCRAILPHVYTHLPFRLPIPRLTTPAFV